MGWIEFTAAFVLFFLSHTLPVRPPLRPLLISVFGQRGFTIVYSTCTSAVTTRYVPRSGHS
ncbi:MAG: NnrU family protein [Pseudomonadota bacterium]